MGIYENRSYHRGLNINMIGDADWTLQIILLDGSIRYMFPYRTNI
jgi:hypothetical protein